MKRIALIGAGSLGTILAAYLSKAGIPLDLVDANRENVTALNEKGARVVGYVEMVQPVTAILPEELTGIYDLIIIATKQPQNERVFDQIEPVMDAETIICTIQNGLPELAIAARFGSERTFGAPVGWGATWLEPGVSALTSLEDEMSFALGSYTGEESAKLFEVKRLLENMAKVTLSHNLMGIRWSKLFTNATFSGMSAALGCQFGDVLTFPERLRILAAIGKEAIQVARAGGVAMEVTNGVDLAKVFYYETPAEEAASHEMYKKYIAAHVKLVASMLQDLEKGIPTEIDSINGVICEEGRRLGIPTPANDLIRAIIKGIEKGELVPQLSNLRLFV